MNFYVLLVYTRILTLRELPNLQYYIILSLFNFLQFNLHYFFGYNSFNFCHYFRKKNFQSVLGKKVKVNFWLYDFIFRFDFNAKA